MLAALFAVEVIAAAVVLTPAGDDAVPHQPAAAPLTVGNQRTVELVNQGGPSGAALLSRVGANIGAAVDAVEAFWGDDWSHHIVVVATGSESQFAEQAGDGSVGQWSDIAAVTVADEVDSRRRVVRGQRIVFAPGAAQMSPAALRIVLGHELFHYAARVDTAPDAPRWLTEGVADFVARVPVMPADRLAPPVTLPSDAELDATGAQRAQAYDRAWWFARFVAERYGPMQLRALYLAGCGPGHTDLATAVRLALDADLADVLVGWQRWAAGT